VQSLSVKGVGPSSVQTSSTVAPGFLLYANANETELVVSGGVALGDGTTNVIVGLFGFGAAEANAVMKPTKTAATTVASSAFRSTRTMLFPSSTGTLERAPCLPGSTPQMVPALGRDSPTDRKTLGGYPGGVNVN
jgi:hypothetical protein